MRQSFIAKTEKNVCELISARVGGLSRGSINALIKKGEVRLNGTKCLSNAALNEGDNLSIFIPKKYLSDCLPKIIYSDENIVIAFKPSLYDVENNLLEFIKQEFSFARPVHRLDRNTQGLVVFALNELAYNELNIAFKNRQIDKYYYALVKGDCKLNGEYRAYLTKDSENSVVKVFSKRVENSKEIISHFERVNGFKGGTLMKVKLVTGRTHQIRAHLSFLGHSIFGDNKYGGTKGELKLMAFKIVFRCLTGELKYLNAKEFSLSPNLDDFCSI